MKWHKISEKLPPLYKPVLICVKKNNKYLYEIAYRYKNFWYIGAEKYEKFIFIYFKHWTEIEQPNNKTIVDK